MFRVTWQHISSTL